MLVIKLEFDTSDLVKNVCNACTNEEFEDLMVEMVDYFDNESLTGRIAERILADV